MSNESERVTLTVESSHQYRTGYEERIRAVALDSGK